VEVERETVMGVVGLRYVDALQQNELFDLCEDDFSSFVDDDYQHGDHAITSVSVNLFPLVMYHSCIIATVKIHYESGIAKNPVIGYYQIDLSIIPKTIIFSFFGSLIAGVPILHGPQLWEE
jgi:hypothetical protein